MPRAVDLTRAGRPRSTIDGDREWERYRRRPGTKSRSPDVPGSHPWALGLGPRRPSSPDERRHRRLPLVMRVDERGCADARVAHERAETRRERRQVSGDGSARVSSVPWTMRPGRHVELERRPRRWRPAGGCDSRSSSDQRSQRARDRAWATAGSTSSHVRSVSPASAGSSPPPRRDRRARATSDKRIALPREHERQRLESVDRPFELEALTN